MPEFFRETKGQSFSQFRIDPEQGRMGQFFDQFRIAFESRASGRGDPEQGRRGQSLVEALIAVAVGALIVGSAIGSIVLTIKLNSQTRSVETANSLGEELLGRVRAVAGSDWSGLYNLAKGSGTKYFLVPGSAGSISVVSGKEGVIESEIRNGLVGIWKLDEASGANAYDSSGIGNNGTVNGSPVRTSPCFVGDCLTFSGTGQYINIPSPTGLPTAAITVSAWVYLTTHINWNDLVANNFSTIGGWNLFVDSGGSALFGVFNGTSQFNASGCASSFTLNTWHHLLGTYDGTTVKVYLDGTQCVTTAALAGQTLYTAGSVRVGDADGTSASHEIDDVRIYNRALSSSEDYQLFNSRPFVRSFAVENVNRDSSGAIATSGGVEDPSTQKITSTVTWTQQGVSANTQLAEFMTRAKDEITNFSNWNGVSGVEGPITDPKGGNYSTSSNVNFGTAGSITITTP